MSGTGRDKISDHSAMAMSKMDDFYIPVMFNTVFKIYRFYSTNSDSWVWELGGSSQRMAWLLGEAKTFHFSTWENVQR